MQASSHIITLQNINFLCLPIWDIGFHVVSPALLHFSLQVPTQSVEC